MDVNAIAADQNSSKVNLETQRHVLVVRRAASVSATEELSASQKYFSDQVTRLGNWNQHDLPQFVPLTSVLCNR